MPWRPISLLWPIALVLTACATCDDRVEDAYIQIMYEVTGLRSTGRPIDELRSDLGIALRSCNLPQTRLESIAIDGLNESALAHLAILADDLDLLARAVEELPSEDDDPSALPIGLSLDAAAYGSERVMQFLVEHGYDVDIADPVTGETPLMASIGRSERDLRVSQLLISLGADVDARSNQDGIQWDAASVAIDEGAVEALRLLLDAGADPLANPENVRLLQERRSMEIESVFEAAGVRAQIPRD